MLEVNMMDTYWSETIPLRTVPVVTVDATRLVRRLVSGIIILARLRSIPLAFIAAPKHIAQMIR